jgi:hypothetical protein
MLLAWDKEERSLPALGLPITGRSRNASSGEAGNQGHEKTPRWTAESNFSGALFF